MKTTALTRNQTATRLPGPREENGERAFCDVLTKLGIEFAYEPHFYPTERKQHPRESPPKGIKPDLMFLWVPGWGELPLHHTRVHWELTTADLVTAETLDPEVALRNLLEAESGEACLPGEAYIARKLDKIADARRMHKRRIGAIELITGHDQEEMMLDPAILLRRLNGTLRTARLRPLSNVPLSTASAAA